MGRHNWALGEWGEASGAGLVQAEEETATGGLKSHLLLSMEK